MRPTLFVLFFAVFSFQFSVFNSVDAADTTPPKTQAMLKPAQADGLNGWYESPLEITLAASDDLSGVKNINWRLTPPGGNFLSQTFSDSLNLAPNPSFEQTTGNTVDDWIFVATPGASGHTDATVAVLGVKSLKMISTENGWSGFRNEAAYVPATPFANMTASVWVKTQNVSGLGAYFRIFVLSRSGGALEVADSVAVTGSADFVRVSKSFAVSANDAYGVFLDLGVFGVGTVWYDVVEIKNAVTDTQVVNTFSSPGLKTLEYYAGDSAQNEELPHKTLDFKIDSTAPTNWRDFESERAGNDHTLKTEIKVDDLISKPDSDSAQFQYSVDGGQTWGYYSDLTSCASNFLTDGWSSAVTTEAENDDSTLEIKTSAVDYCNSNWEICKIIKFKVLDRAGNESQKSVCINGSFIEASGDVGSNYNISFSATGASDNSDGVIYSKNLITGFTSVYNWRLENYETSSLTNYDAWLSQFPAATPLPGGKLPTTSGRYLNNSSFTISSSTLPSDFSTKSFAVVVFVNGNLTINRDFSLSNTAALAFIVAGKILVDNKVENIAAAFLANETFESSYNGQGKNKLTIFGLAAADSFIFNRRLSNDDESEPAEQIIYQPRYFTLLSPFLGQSSISWREVAP